MISFIDVGYVALNGTVLCEGRIVEKLHKFAIMEYMNAPLQHFYRITEENLGVRTRSAEDSG
jgi:hypothetical protein